MQLIDLYLYSFKAFHQTADLGINRIPGHIVIVVDCSTRTGKEILELFVQNKFSGRYTFMLILLLVGSNFC